MKRNWIIIALMLIALPMMAQNRQPQVIDKVVAVVGKNIILQSDIENQYIQYRMQGMAEGTGQEVRTRILEDLLLQKLMLNQAEMDSITVTDEEVERQMDQKLQYFISRFGSKEKMEAQFGKTLT
jgi:peptidyl-prolyl cis-trans isomerase SurA